MEIEKNKLNFSVYEIWLKIDDFISVFRNVAEYKALNVFMNFPYKYLTCFSHNLHVIKYKWEKEWYLIENKQINCKLITNKLIYSKTKLNSTFYNNAFI